RHRIWVPRRAASSISGRWRAIMSSLSAGMLDALASGAWTWVTPQMIFLDTGRSLFQKQAAQDVAGDAAAILGGRADVVDGRDVALERGAQVGRGGPAAGGR